MARQLTQAQLNNLGAKVVTRPVVWGNLVQRSWGDEYKAPDRGVYEFTGGRRFDSTDTGTTGVYATDNYEGILLDNAQYPDMPSYLLVEDLSQLDQN